MSTYITALVAGPYASVHDEHDGIPLGHLLPPVAGAAPRPRRPVHRHQAGLRLLPPGLRLPLPLRQVRPAVRAGVQRRRDGERRRRHVPRGLRLPLQGDRRGVRAARRDGAARDGPHVVRRPRDHALVGRPVAQRELRDLHVGALPGRGHPLHARLDDLRQHGEDLGLPPGPAALDAPDRRRHRRHRGRQGQLRRHHLRQGRVGAQAARRLGRPGRLPVGAADATSARTSTATPCSPTCSGALERASGRDLSDWSAEWLETAGVNTLRPVFETDGDGRLTSFTVVQEAPEQWPTLRSHRVAIGCYDLVDGRLRRTAREELDVVGAKTEVPGAGRPAPARPRARQRRRPDLRQDPARRALAARRSSPTSATSRSRCRARCAGRRPGT